MVAPVAGSIEPGPLRVHDTVPVVLFSVAVKVTAAPPAVTVVLPGEMLRLGLLSFPPEPPQARQSRSTPAAATRRRLIIGYTPLLLVNGEDWASGATRARLTTGAKVSREPAPGPRIWLLELCHQRWDGVDARHLPPLSVLFVKGLATSTTTTTTREAGRNVVCASVAPERP